MPIYGVDLCSSSLQQIAQFLRLLAHMEARSVLNIRPPTSRSSSWAHCCLYPFSGLPCRGLVFDRVWGEFLWDLVLWAQLFLCHEDVSLFLDLHVWFESPAQIWQGCSIFRTSAILTVKVSFMVNVVDLSDFSPCVFTMITDVSLKYLFPFTPYSVFIP
jgi:hypothetical protein